MQNSIGVPKGALYVLSGAAAVTACWLTYRHLSQSRSQSEPTLHRSNAVRRRRRRWREGHRPIELDHDPTTRALEHLRRREETGQGYGTYLNRHYVTGDLVNTSGDAFGMLPSRIEHIHAIIRDANEPPQLVSEQLLMHIQARFVLQFLQAEYPTGYVVGPDTSELQAALHPHIPPGLISGAIGIHDLGVAVIPEDMNFGERSQEDTGGRVQDPTGLAQALTGDGGRRSSADTDQEEDHTVLDLLYRIGEERAKQSGYQHRGVECNGCGMQPIRGIRYHCANCWDYDLCEACEVQQIHHKTHVFYKIRIPAPTRGQIKLVQPKWYPGNPNACLLGIPHALKEELLKDTSLDRQDLDAMYDQFKCIAGAAVKDDPDGIGMAIDRPSFDRYFTSTSADRPPYPNLIYDRIFAFYDQNGDGVVIFSEFVKSMAELAHNTSREARIRRLFKAFDFDGDGYVDRKDFLYLMRAHYQLNKELAHEMIYARDDAVLSEEDIREVIHGSNPISAVFGGNNFPGHQSRHGQGKQTNTYGDFVFDGNGESEILQNDSDMRGDRAEAIARQNVDTRSIVQARHQQQPRDESLVGGFESQINLLISTGSQLVTNQVNGAGEMERLVQAASRWPNDHITEEDIVEALGAPLALEEIVEPDDQQRVLRFQRERLWRQLETSNNEQEVDAIKARWQRRQFYLDEEEGFSKPAGYPESLSSDEDIGYVNGVSEPSHKLSSRTLSMRSRSSSKVRFDETANNDIDGKSEASSSRNTPVNERWGGFEITQPDRDVGVEIIYEAVEEAFNNMLDHFFKDREDQAMAAKTSRKFRKEHASELEGYKSRLAVEARRQHEALLAADMERTQALLDAAAPAASQLGQEVADNIERAPQDTVEHEEDLENEPSDSVTESVPAGGLESSDRTLPQNRPNDPGFNLSTETDVKSLDIDVLAKLHLENMVEEEAEKRGGFGRLNFHEFKQKLRGDTGHDIDVGAEGQDEDVFWEERADLGRFSFLSSWIEMASF